MYYHLKGNGFRLLQWGPTTMFQFQPRMDKPMTGSREGLQRVHVFNSDCR